MEITLRVSVGRRQRAERMGKKVQGIRSIIVRDKIDRRRLR